MEESFAYWQILVFILVLGLCTSACYFQFMAWWILVWISNGFYVGRKLCIFALF